MRNSSVSTLAALLAAKPSSRQQWEYAGATAQGTVGVGANVLLGGSSNQITLQPVSVKGSVGLNAAAGVAALSLHKAP